MTSEIFGDCIPANLLILLENQKLLRPNLDENEILFLIIIYIVCETGITPECPGYEDHLSREYNVHTVAHVARADVEKLYHTVIENTVKIFKCHMNFAALGKCTLIGLPSTESEPPYLTVCMYIQNPKLVKAVSLNTSKFLSRNAAGEIQFKFPNLLSCTVKDTLAVPTKQVLSFYNGVGVFAHIQAIPYHIFKIIKENLPNDEAEQLETLCSVNFHT